MLIQLNHYSVRLAMKISVHSYYYKTSPESFHEKANRLLYEKLQVVWSVMIISVVVIFNGTQEPD